MSQFLTQCCGSMQISKESCLPVMMKTECSIPFTEEWLDEQSSQSIYEALAKCIGSLQNQFIEGLVILNKMEQFLSSLSEDKKLFPCDQTSPNFLIKNNTQSEKIAESVKPNRKKKKELNVLECSQPSSTQTSSDGEPQETANETIFPVAEKAESICNNMKFKTLYVKTKICRYHVFGKCERGAECSFAHSYQELMHLPNYHKTRLCRNYTKSGSCPKSEQCHFAHGYSDLKRSLNPLDTQTVAPQEPLQKSAQTELKCAQSKQGKKALTSTKHKESNKKENEEQSQNATIETASPNELPDRTKPSDTFKIEQAQESERSRELQNEALFMSNSIHNTVVSSIASSFLQNSGDYIDDNATDSNVDSVKLRAENYSSMIDQKDVSTNHLEDSDSLCSSQLMFNWQNFLQINSMTSNDERNDFLENLSHILKSNPLKPAEYDGGQNDSSNDTATPSQMQQFSPYDSCPFSATWAEVSPGISTTKFQSNKPFKSTRSNSSEQIDDNKKSSNYIEICELPSLWFDQSSMPVSIKEKDTSRDFKDLLSPIHQQQTNLVDVCSQSKKQVQTQNHYQKLDQYAKELRSTSNIEINRAQGDRPIANQTYPEARLSQRTIETFENKENFLPSRNLEQNFEDQDTRVGSLLPSAKTSSSSALTDISGNISAMANHRASLQF